MSLVFLEKPNAVDFAKNGLRYKVQTDYIRTQGEKASFYFKKVGDLAQWEGFKVPIPNSSDIITAVASTTSEDDQYGWSMAIRYDVTIDETVSDLKKLYNFDKYYNISKLDTDKILFEAKETGLIDTSLIEYTNPINPGYEFDEINYVLNEGVDEEVWANFAVRCKIYYRNEDVCELKLDVDKDGIIELEAGKFLNTNFFDKGNIGTELTKITDNFAFKIGFAQNIEDGKYPYHFNEVKAIPGKVPFNEYPSYNFNDAVFLTSLKKLDTYSEAFHKLTFFSANNTALIIKFNLDIYYTDGTNDLIEMSSLNNEKNDLFQLNFFISALLTYADTEKEVYKIVFLSDYGTDKVVFNIQEQSFVDKQFLFKNDFGFWETLNCKGNKKESTKIERDIFKKHVGAGYSSDEGEYISNIRESHSEFEVETGSREKQEVKQITQALRSRDFYEIVDNKYIKCELLNKDALIFDEADDLQNIVIKYRYSFDD